MAVVRAALAQGLEVVCIVRASSGKLAGLPQSDRVHLVFSDLSGYGVLPAPVEDCDAFLHLAWDKTYGASRDDTTTQVENITFTLDAVHLARRMGCKVFVGVGSQAEYGPVQVDLTPETPVNPQSGYGIAKYAAGRLSALLCAQLGMRQSWARVLSVYGLGDASYTLTSYVINEVRAGRSPSLTLCEQQWDYIYSDDAARALLCIMETGREGVAYPVGTGQGRRLSEYVEIIRNLINPSVRLGFGDKPYYPYQPMHLVADITALTRDTGWRPETDFVDGIKEVLSSM